MAQHEIIIIGGGLNSLITAASLGKAGRNVLVLESLDEVGGMTSSLEFSPGFTCNLIHDYLPWIDPRIFKQFNLSSGALKMDSTNLTQIALDKTDNPIYFYTDAEKTSESIAFHSKQDAKNWVSFSKLVNNLSPLLEKLSQKTLVNIHDFTMKNVLSMSSLFPTLLKKGSRNVVDLIRVMPMMMPELMDEWFETPLLRGMLSSKGIRHLSHGPFAAGTGLNFLHQHLYGNGVIFNKSFINGGTHKLAESIGNYCESKGVNIRTKSKVNSINIVNYRCDSVTLSTGEYISAELFISGLDPQNTFNYLIGLDQLNPIFRTQLKNIKYRGSTARIHFALNTLPEIKGISENQMDTVFSISPSIEYIERASDSVKYGDISENPVLEFVIPTINYPNFAPTGKHVLSTTVQYAPYHLRNQHWSKELKEQLKNNVIRILETVIPGFSSIVDSSLVVTPVDLEHQFGLTEGNLNHGEMTLDQLMIMRPMLGYSHYNSPFENLFLCGSGTHPGGGLHGANGLNVAREILNK